MQLPSVSPSAHPRHDACGSPWLLPESGRVLYCLISPGHDGTHQAYYRDRLHEWRDAEADEGGTA